MLELLAPAGNLDAVIAAVQNGADAVYMGFGDGFNARRSADNFTQESFAKAVRYCHIRGCKVYVTLNTLVGDREMDAAAALAQQASDAGADAILVQDLGLARVLRAALPDIPLHASTQMSIHNLAGVEAAAEMGITRAVLARELSLEQIRFISQHASIETEVFVHGALCFCYSGQCYMSALIGRRSGNRGACAQPCRMQYSMGGRMDEYPLSLRDNCLADYLQQLEDAGVACVKIEGRMKRPEYVAVVTDVYARCIHEHRVPTQEENDRLALAFSRQGFTQGYLLGEKGPDMLGTRAAEPDREAEKMFTAARKAYADGERRRVPVKFYAKVQTGEPVMAAVMDEEGHRAVLTGPVPEPAQRAPLTASTRAEPRRPVCQNGRHALLFHRHREPHRPGSLSSGGRRQRPAPPAHHRPEGGARGPARAAESAAAAVSGGQALFCRPRAHRAGASGRAAHAGACRAAPGVCICAGRDPRQ